MSCASHREDCRQCHSSGCIFCEVISQGSGGDDVDYACIDDTSCQRLKVSRPGTAEANLISLDQCPSSTTTSRLQSTTASGFLAAENAFESSAASSDDDWGAAQWLLVLAPVLVVLLACGCFVAAIRRWQRNRERKVHVEPVNATSPGAGQQANWDFTSMGPLKAIDLHGIEEAIQAAEKDGKAKGGSYRAAQRRLVFCSDNKLSVPLLQQLQTMLKRHPTLAVSLDTDWRKADLKTVECLVPLLEFGSRCLLRSSKVDGDGRLLLPPKLPLTTAGLLTRVLATASHSEVDEVVFETPDLQGQKTVAVPLSPLRLSCRELNFKSFGLHDVGTIAACAFLEPVASRLQVVRLIENNITDAGLKTLVEICGLAGASLRELVLTANRIADEGAKSIAEALPNCDALERLLLDRNRIGTAGAKALAARLPRSNVRELVLGSHLGGNPVGPEGAEAFASTVDDKMARAAADRAARLTALSLEDCELGERGAKALAAKLPRSALTTLSVARCGIGDAGAKEIVLALPDSMASLDLAGNRLTESAASVVADALHKCPTLAVSLAQNKISPHLQAALREEHAGRLRL
mmetsp:Transcript_62292/g.148716  ORF Transcript_62292/g.148716 Transcript_62292/m.148716 type:complete len:579 (+) Transcript_62292:70-1806(+)